MPSSPEVALAEHGTDVIVVRPVGDFDLDSNHLLHAAFTDSVTPQRSKVVVDLSGTTFLDSTALGTIIGSARRATASGGWLRFVAPSRYVEKVLKVTALDIAFGVYDTVEEAVEA
jgi:anti-anti-sigma factor